MASYVLTGSIEINPDLLGLIRVGRANRYTPEGRKDLLGYRPSLPLLVNSLTVKNEVGIVAANVPENGHFLISPLFTGGAGDPLYDQGAKPGSIGTKIIQGVTTVYVFRTPYTDEVVWHVAVADNGDVEESGFHRWDGETWQPYKTWPERALDGMRAFEILDPDKIYDYYARLVGATFTSWMVDARAMLDFLDPDRCPAELLPKLAENVGLILDATEQEEVQRQKVKDAIPTYKEKGLVRAVILRLRSLGFTGYPREIWVNPDDPGNWTDDTTGEKGNNWIEVIHGSRYRTPRVGLLFVGAEQPFDGETVVINDYSTTVIFGFGSGGDVVVPIGADAEETKDNLIAAINGSALTVTASAAPLTDWPEITLDGGAIASDSVIILTFNWHFPSSRISVHINRVGGQPLSMTTPAAALLEFKEFIATQLGEDVLPAPIDIRFFATDLEVGPSGFGLGEALGVSDVLTLTWALTPTVTFNSTVNVTGSGTLFTTEITAGDYIRLDSFGIWVEVESVTDDTHLVLVTPYLSSGSGASSAKKEA